MNLYRAAIPEAKPADVIDWSQANVKVDGHSFDASRTPQLIKPIRAMTDADTRLGTLVKPVQVGGSTAGEVIANYWAAFENGLLQYNWQNDEAAVKRWHERIKPSLESNKWIRRSGGRFEETICTARYPNCTVRVQGVFMESALDSDTVPLQINEEVHLWKAGFLSKARRRQTQVWNAKAFDISNASTDGDQLCLAWEDGTMETWEVICPGCGQPHEMHFRWKPDHPELGGLRWDSDGCRMDKGRFNYNKLEKTIRYQFPCGHTILDVASQRRTMKGDYSAPQNEGAHISHRSWNFEAVCCDAIRWLSLIQEWHSGIRSMRSGDLEPMRRFVTERECKFWSPEHSIPFHGEIVISQGITKKREGKKDRVARLWKADWQQGIKQLGQLEHFWLVIKDVDKDCNDEIIFEGRLDTEAELLATLNEYDAIAHGGGVVDCSKNTKHLLEFCYRNKFNAIMSNLSRMGGFLHRSDGVRRFYDEGSAICGKLNVAPVFEPVLTKDGAMPDQREPLVINVAKGGMIANHFFVREHKQRVLLAAKTEGREAKPADYIECVIPEDVSDAFKYQYEAWQRVGRDAKKATDEVYSGQERFQQIRRDDHLMICCAGIDMLKDWSGLLGERLEVLGIKRNGTDHE